MNAAQRKFLTEAIEKQYKKQREELRHKKPVEPSLNNYLTAAILDKTFQLQPMDQITENIHKRVISLGQNKTLLNTTTEVWGRDADNEREQKTLSIPASVLFVMPPGYVTAMEQYKAEKDQWDAEWAELENSFEAMKIKVQLGSDKALSALVDQADQLCSMSLTASSKLMLTAPSKE